MIVSYDTMASERDNLVQRRCEQWTCSSELDNGKYYNGVRVKLS